MNSKKTKFDPIFIVGCSRSGTTLLQSILGNHPDLAVFPESNLLYYVLDDLDFRRWGSLIGRRQIPRAMTGRLLNGMGFTSVMYKESAEGFLEANASHCESDLFNDREYSIRTVFSKFTRVMEMRSQGRRWIEKSPQNIFCVHLIRKYWPDACILHIVREGRDTVASIMDAARKYTSFGYRFGDPLGLEKSVQYYNRAVKISVRHGNKPHNLIVRYEDLVDYPSLALEPVAKLLCIDISSDMLEYRTDQIAHTREVWKENSKTISVQKSKFDDVLSAKQRAYVEKNIVSADRLFPKRIAP